MLPLLLAAGCANSLVMSTGTSFGLKGDAGQQGRQSIEVGYQRSEGVFHPVLVCKTDAGEDGYLDVPTFGAYSVVIKWPLGDVLAGNLTGPGSEPAGAVHVRQVLASGGAAGVLAEVYGAKLGKALNETQITAATAQTHCTDNLEELGPVRSATSQTE